MLGHTYGFNFFGDGLHIHWGKQHGSAMTRSPWSRCHGSGGTGNIWFSVNLKLTRSRIYCAMEPSSTGTPRFKRRVDCGLARGYRIDDMRNTSTSSSVTRLVKSQVLGRWCSRMQLHHVPGGRLSRLEGECRLSENSDEPQPHDSHSSAGLPRDVQHCRGSQGAGRSSQVLQGLGAHGRCQQRPGHVPPRRSTGNLVPYPGAPPVDRRGRFQLDRGTDPNRLTPQTRCPAGLTNGMP